MIAHIALVARVTISLSVAVFGKMGAVLRGIDVIIKSLSTICVFALFLAACGSDPGDRAAAGGALGAAGGAVIGAATGGVSVLGGALVGAAAGAVGGAVTESDDVDLGEPPWRQDGDSADSRRVAPQTVAKLGDTDARRRPLVREIQEGLARLGYYAGVRDGRMGPLTRLAIGRYQADHAIAVDRRASKALLRHITDQAAHG